MKACPILDRGLGSRIETWISCHPSAEIKTYEMTILDLIIVRSLRLYDPRDGAE